MIFFVLPLLLAAALGGGLTFLNDRQDNDLERQYTPRKGPSKVTRAFVSENFPNDNSMFSEERLYDQGNFASFIAVATDDVNVLANGAFEEVSRLNQDILNITVTSGLNGSVGFRDLCERASGECFSNMILEILDSEGRGGVSFPIHPSPSGPVFLGSALGGVVTNGNGSVVSAQAVKLVYYLDDQESTADATMSWLIEFKTLLSEWKERGSQHISVRNTATLMLVLFSLTVTRLKTLLQT